MSSKKTIHLVIFGVGNVGKTLIKQVLESGEHFEQNKQLLIKIPVITNSKLMLLKSDGISKFKESNLYLNENVKQYNVSEVIDFVASEKFNNLIAIDATA